MSSVKRGFCYDANRFGALSTLRSPPLARGVTEHVSGTTSVHQGMSTCALNTALPPARLFMWVDPPGRCAQLELRRYMLGVGSATGAGVLPA